AEGQRALAEEREQAARRQLYADNMNKAYRAWQAGDFTRAEELLDQVVPRPGQEDVRGCEWRMLRRLCEQRPRIRTTLCGHTGDVYFAAYSPNGSTLATAGKDGTIRLWDAVTGKEQTTLTKHTDEVNWVSFSPDGKTFASAADDGTVRLWETGTGRLVKTLGPFSAAAVGVVYAPDGRTIVAGLGNGALIAWETESLHPHNLPPVH